MSTAPLAVVRRFVEEYQSQHDVGVAEELLADDFVDHTPFGPFPPDRNGVLALFGMLIAAFPDLHAEIHDQLVDGDKVVTRKTFRATQDGEFMGMPPSGRAVAFDVIDIVRVRDGRMVDHWNVVDSMALMTQLGAIPSAV
jgi:predicted SnoaL-like aldol condensation-catalyzing enzyme